MAFLFALVCQSPRVPTGNGLPDIRASAGRIGTRIGTRNMQTPVYAGVSRALGVGLEPTTLRLTAECSAIELPQIYGVTAFSVWANT